MSIRTFFSGIVAAALVCSCGGSKPDVQKDGAPASRASELDSVSQRVFSYAEDTAIAPLVKGWPAPSVEDKEDTISDADAGSAEMVYRIQLYTSQNRAEATAMREEAKVDFGDQVRLDFETPYYKLRIGSFAKPEDADELLRKARRLGYRGAWVVRVRAPSGKQ